MGKVMFTISYEINPEKRDEYLALTTRMKQHLAQKNGKAYSIYEQKGKKNSFSEVFIFNSMAEYDQLEDEDEQMGQFMGELEALMINGKMKYSTLIELE
jgi:L-rhamnose mutarotase